MSNYIMNQCWPLQLPPTTKAVLMSLADQADNCGGCFPSIATICTRTCFKKDAVIKAIAWLETKNIVIADRSNGRRTTYRIVVEAAGVGENDRSAKTEDRSVKTTNRSVKTSYQSARSTLTISNHQESKITISKKNITELDLLMEIDGMDKQLAMDWLCVRKAKKAPLTRTALQQLVAEAGKAGLTPLQAVQMAAANSWAGFNASWLNKQRGEDNEKCEFQAISYRQPKLTAVQADLERRLSAQGWGHENG